MRHRKSFNHLGRKKAHRKAMLSNMASSLIMHKRINTTVAKAKALKVFVEPLITRAKEDTTHNRRIVFRSLQNKDAVSELFRQISVKVADRPGGYTRILKIGARLGDNAEMCIIELVDYNENMLTAKETGTKKKRTRRGRSGAGSSTEQPVAEKAPKAETKTKEAPKAEKIEEKAEKAPEKAKKEEKKAEEKPEAKVEEKKAEEKSEDDKEKK
ncbi:MAG: 50S ribosomal protein L17 [Bacteroidales bacterium]|jgi:large subunit ribosomal protein L17|nr:50S ribosomal protein L17 [Bacteroidales bacterium]